MRLLCIADIHIGSIKDTEYVYHTLKDIFDRELLQHKTDAVILLGDYFDRSLRVNEEFTTLSIQIMLHLISLCKRRKCKLRIVYGTESHDANQYVLFHHFLKDPDLDFKIMYHVEEEELFKGIHVLYLPEEYIEDESYYKEYFNKKYTYIFGHGIIVEGMPMIQFDNKPKSNEKRVARFRSKQLSKICDICLFGHYHVNCLPEKNVGYVGSLFRTCFGEEKDKGYYIIQDKELQFVKNENAYTFKTYEFDDTSSIYQNKEDLIQTIQKIKEENKKLFEGIEFGKIRLKFHIPKDIDEEFKISLRDALSLDKNISLLFIDKKDELEEDVKESIDVEYNFILDTSLNIYDKLYQYMDKKYDLDISLDELKKYIEEDFTL